CKGPKSFYRTNEGEYETMEFNPKIRRFVYELRFPTHAQDVNRILWKLLCGGATVSGLSAKKLYICMPEISILGHTCNSYGRRADDTHVIKIVNWPACKTIS
ncbi:hypothetical protein SISNIDRAFT_398732, partial [Sistotremastrum niveocremeum HHB9708]